jgi:hypothetical protein
MTYVAAEARQQLLDGIGDATDELASALAALGAAYETLDERNGDRLEAELFRPLQTAFGRAQRAHAGFAERHGLPSRTFPTPTAGHRGVREQIDRALAAIARADGGLSTLQDSMLPVEVGDAELRAGLADVREHVAPLPATARRFLSTLGR